MEECQKEVKDFIIKAAKPSEKIHKIIEQNVLVQHLSKKMEDANKIYFKNNFIHKNMHNVFIRQ